MNPTSSAAPPPLTSASTLFWGAPEWATAAAVLLCVALLVLAGAYARVGAGRSIKILAATLKALGFAALVFCLVEPLLGGSRPKPGANAFAVLVDNSQSLQIHDAGAPTTRADWLRAHLRADLPWRTRLAQDFDVRPYLFDSHLRGVEDFDTLACDGTGSALGTSLQALARRFRGLPLAGVLVLTDGNRTDPGDIDVVGLPPIYPVVPPSAGSGRDIGVRDVSVSQANFEAAPVVLRAEIVAAGYRDEPIRIVVFDEQGREVARQEVTPPTADGSKPLACRFQFRPDAKGVRFYRVHASSVAAAIATDPAAALAAEEQTAANNDRLVVVDQGEGPYRILYVSGRPSWEFKFLNRAIEADKQVNLVALIRLAKRQPKFDFQAAGNRTVSPLFNGFDNADPEAVEAADQPVLVRFHTRDPAELRDGFPKTAEALFDYDAVILDDIEAGFFTPDQMALLQNFVSRRGGGLLMLGGPDSFAAGKYDRTPVGDLLPVYIDRGGDAPPGPTEADPGPAEHRLVLTREGWLQPWVRTRKTEEDERTRLAAMPAFDAPNGVGGIKPGAAVLAQVRDATGAVVPALVAQPFGKGHVAALLIGDLWRWGLRRASPAEDDLDRSWRQTVRWLVADVPQRVEVALRSKTDAAAPTVEVIVRARDAQYRPLDDSKVAIDVTLPGGEHLPVIAEPMGDEPGAYRAAIVTRDPGPYRFQATVAAADGTTVGTRAAGWAAQPAADEFAHLQPNHAGLADLARRTAGNIVEGDQLAAFVAGLPARKAPVVEPWTAPLWHQPFYFLIAVACLAAEWGIRRTHGLA